MVLGHDGTLSAREHDMLLVIYLCERNWPRYRYDYSISMCYSDAQNSLVLIGLITKDRLEANQMVRQKIITGSARGHNSGKIDNLGGSVRRVSAGQT